MMEGREYHIHHHLHFEPELLPLVRRIEHALGQILHHQGTIMTNFTVLQGDLDAIKAGVTALLQKVADLGGSPADQTTVDALATEAQTILDAMNATGPTGATGAPATP